MYQRQLLLPEQVLQIKKDEEERKKKEEEEERARVQREGQVPILIGRAPVPEPRSAPLARRAGEVAGHETKYTKMHTLCLLWCPAAPQRSDTGVLAQCCMDF